MLGHVHSTDRRSNVPAATVGAVAIGLWAALVAAGSIGVLAEPLRVVLTWLALGLAAVLVRPNWRLGSIVSLAVLIATPLLATTGPIHEVLVVAAILAVFADRRDGADRSVLLVGAGAVLLFGLYRIAYDSLPPIWFVARSIGQSMGHVAGAMAGQSLSVGATLAGLDMLVLMTAFGLGWLANTQGPRFHRSLFAASAILGAHFLYLLTLGHAPIVAGHLPIGPPPTFQHPYVPPPWDGTKAVQQLLPWDLPALAALMHVTIACFMVRWVPWRVAETKRNRLGSQHGSPSTTYRDAMSVTVPIGLAIALAAAATVSWGSASLEGKALVANRNGQIDWLKPQHDRYGQQSAGMFGMLPALIESLGGHLNVSVNPAHALDDCDLLLLLRPTEPLPQADHDRIWEFVRRGGALLVVATPVDQPGSAADCCNALLSPTAIETRNDVAISETENWLHACQRLTHPATTAVDPRGGWSSSGVGSSLEIRWPARPLIVGRWGWSDPGRDAALSGVHRFEAGERLGDLVLAAEQTIGEGTVVVLADGNGLTNEGIVRDYQWVGRLLCYLADRRGNPTAIWRQVAILCLSVLLIVTLYRRWDSPCFVATALTLAISLVLSAAASRTMTQIVPDGRRILDPDLVATAEAEPNQAGKLAYIDASHLEAYSDRDWAFDAVNGLALNLMRNGFLTLSLPTIDRAWLDRAAIVVSVAPARRFSPHEREIVGEFVRKGGVLICTVGGEDALASQSLLADLGLRVPRSPVPTTGVQREPEPMGNFRSLFLDANDYDAGDYRVGVAFHAGWPVDTSGDESEVFVVGKRDVPIVVCRRVGQGKVVLIGDTGFAMNKNLEYIGGEPFDGRYENAQFWRWLVSRVIRADDWIPPPPPEPNAESSDAEEVQE